MRSGRPGRSRERSSSRKRAKSRGGRIRPERGVAARRQLRADRRPGDNSGVGAAWVFTRSGTTWTQQGAKLTGTGESGNGDFGESVALSSEGNTALIGGPNDKEGVGAAWVFTRSGTTWTQQGEKLTGSAEVREGEPGGHGEFGYSVALSAEGNTALSAAPTTAAPSAPRGCSRARARPGPSRAKSSPANGESGAGEFGRSVALSAEDGEHRADRRPRRQSRRGRHRGCSRAKRKRPGPSRAEAHRQRGDAAPGDFGNSVAVSADGEYALVGGPRDNGSIGGAWVFLRAGTTWAQQGSKLVAKSGEETGAGEFGYERRDRRQRRQLRADRRPDGQRRNRRRVGVPAHGHHLGSAGCQTRREKRRRDRCGRCSARAWRSRPKASTV